MEKNQMACLFNTLSLTRLHQCIVLKHSIADPWVPKFFVIEFFYERSREVAFMLENPAGKIFPQYLQYPLSSI